MASATYDSVARIWERHLASDGTAEACRDFYVSLLSGTAGRILELGVGTGRISRELVRRGVPAVGIDVSSAMLSQALDSADHPMLVRGRFPDLPFRRGAFREVVSPQFTLGHLADGDAWRELLHSVRSVLVPGGRLVFDLFNMDERWTGNVHRTERLLYSGPDPDDQSLTLRVSMDVELQIHDRWIHEKVIAERLYLDGAIASSDTISLDFKLVGQSEVAVYAVNAGFEIEATFGDFSGHALERDSPYMVWVLRRPSQIS